LGQRKKVREMRKGLGLTALLITASLVLVGGGWGEKNSTPGVFSGTIAKMDLAAKGIVVRNNEAEMTFQWNSKTRVKGAGGEELNLGDLKEGVMVTVLYREESRNRVANRIDVKRMNSKALKGVSLPFDCGISVC
jgi:hypothetical protein